MNAYTIEFMNECLKKPGKAWIEANSEQEARERFAQNHREFCRITKIICTHKQPALTWSEGEVENLNSFYSGIDM